MTTTMRSGLALILLAGLASGCGGGASPTDPHGVDPASPDVAEVTRQLAENPAYIDEDVHASEEPTAADAGNGVAAEAALAVDALRPIHFWRHITGVRRSFEFAFSDSDSVGRPATAVVTVHRRLTGTFNILVGSRNDSAYERRVIRKPLEDHWVRRILLRRVVVADSPDPRWRVVGLSGVAVTSARAETRIASVRIESADLDTTIVDPLAFFRLRRVLRFDRDDSVTVTVTTQRPDDVVVLQHRFRRYRFRSNGDNTYTGVFRAAFLARVNHAGVNALSRGTLFDEDARYDSRAWILPYVVRPTDLADGR